MSESDRQSGESAARPLELRVPAAVLRIWTGDDDGVVRDLVAELLTDLGGVHRTGPAEFAITPEAADPALFDTAVDRCRRLPAALARRLGDRAPELRILVSPGEVLHCGDEWELVPDRVAEDFAARPPELEPNAVHLTGWAVNQLEQPASTEPAGSYDGPSGRALPLVKVGASPYSPTPWRNPELLTRYLKWVPRPTVMAALHEGLEAPALRVHGAVGTGKSRAVWEALTRTQGMRLWLRTQPARRGGTPLSQQIAEQLLAPSDAQRADPGHPAFDDDRHHRVLEPLLAAPGREPAGNEEAAERVLAALDRLAVATGRAIHLVFDDFEQVSSGDLELLGLLLEAPTLGSAFRPVLVGRSGLLLTALTDLDDVEVPPLDELEMARFAERLYAGLSLPKPLQERFLEATRGYPFALEEGMISLIRSKSLRRIYGSFFFSGDEEASYRPSLRLICHLQAEAGRLGEPAPAYLLSLLGMGGPPAEVAAAASIFAPRTPFRWETTALESGLLQQVESPWGPGVTISCPAYAKALAHGLTAEAVPRVRRILGEILAARSRTGEAHWEAYRLLSGGPQAVQPLLKTLKTDFVAQIPHSRLYDSLTAELAAHRERGGEAATEVDLLWALLPLVRRLGRLHRHTGDLARGVELTLEQPRRLLALASVKAEMDTEAGRYREAEATIQTALRGTRGTDQRKQTLLVIQLGRLFLRQERFTEAKELFRSLGRALSQQGSIPLAATCDYYLGNIALHEYRLEEAQIFHEKALRTRREQNLTRPAGYSLSALGAVSLALGDYPRGLAYYEEAHQLLEGSGDGVDMSYTLLGIGRALTRLGDATAATKPLRQALELREGKHDAAGEAIARLAVAGNYLDLGHAETALAEARHAHFHLDLLSLKGRLADAEQLLGRIRLARRQYAEAERHLSAAVDQHRRAGDRMAAGIDLAWLVETAIADEDESAIRRHTADLRASVSDDWQRDLDEQLHFRLFRGLQWLSGRGHNVGDPLPYLERAYREILRKAAPLDPEQRHRYLFQVPDNQAIVDSATRSGLADAGRPTGAQA